MIKSQFGVVFLKLNQHGWSMKEMILLSSILFAFLLLIVFMIAQIQGSFSKSEVDVEMYENVEWNVLNSAIDYYGENFDGDENVRVTTSKLVKDGYLDSSILKVNQDTCSGYVKFSNEDPRVYIRCGKYKTKGYQEQVVYGFKANA